MSQFLMKVCMCGCGGWGVAVGVGRHCWLFTPGSVKRMASRRCVDLRIKWLGLPNSSSIVYQKRRTRQQRAWNGAEKTSLKSRRPRDAHFKAKDRAGEGGGGDHRGMDKRVGWGIRSRRRRREHERWHSLRLFSWTKEKRKCITKNYRLRKKMW